MPGVRHACTTGLSTFQHAVVSRLAITTAGSLMGGTTPRLDQRHAGQEALLNVTRPPAVPLLEHPLREVIEVAPPRDRIVCLVIHVPHVRDVVRLEIPMHSLADRDQPVL